MNLRILSIVFWPTNLIWCFYYLSKGGVKIWSFVLSKKIYFLLKLLYFTKMVSLSNSFSLIFLLNLKAINNFLKSLPLLLLLSQLRISNFQLLQHLIQTLLHLLFFLTKQSQLLLHKMILKFQFLYLNQWFLQLRSQLIRIFLITINIFNGLCKFFTMISNNTLFNIILTLI